MTKIELIYMEKMADIAKTLGHRHRLSLLNHIAQAECSVEVLAELCHLSIANTSQHLQHLRRAGFVKTRREGKNIHYRLGDGPINGLLLSLRDYVEFQQVAMQQVINDSISKLSKLEAVSIEQLLADMHDQSIVVLDVRSHEEYASGHLVGAINIPTAELGQRLSELPLKSYIVAYCRGPYCVLSTEAVRMLNSKGYMAKRLAAGFPEWKAAGLPIG